MIKLSKSSKLMSLGVALSLGWFVLEACDCDETKEDQFPGFWVACVGNKPTLMTYNGNNPSVVTSDPAGNFNPSQWDCSTPGSPPRSKSSSPAFPSSTLAGPGGSSVKNPAAKRPAVSAATPGTSAYNPQPLRDLPFIPQMPLPTPQQCDSSYPDVFQTVHTQALVTRVSTCPFAVKATIPVQTRPLQVEVTPDGSTAIVTSFDNAVNFIDVATNKVTFTFNTDPLINPNGIAISPDGTKVYVSSFNTNFPAVIVIDIATHKLLATMQTTMSYPSGLTLTPDGSQIWVVAPLANNVDIFDTQTNTRVTTLNIGYATQVAFNAVGTRAYITSAATTPGKVMVVNAATYQILSSFTVGANPTDIAMSYGDQFLVVNNNDDGSISVIDLLKNKVQTAAIGPNPSGISFVH